MKNLICLPNVDFNHTWERQHEFLSYFTDFSDFSSTVVLPSGLVEFYNYKAIKSKIRNFCISPKMKQSDVFVDQMAADLILKFDNVYHLGRHSSRLESLVSTLLNKEIINNLPIFDVCYFTYSNFLTLDIAAKAKLSILDLAEFRPANLVLSRSAIRNELKAVAIANIVLCDSIRTLEYYANLFPNETQKFHYVPQGVPEGLVLNSSNQYIDKEIPKVCCYLGNLHHAIDYEYLADIVDLNPNWNFKFCGRIYDERARSLLAKKNCIYYGLIDKSEITGFLSGASFGLIPYLVNDWTDGVSPTKYYEYLASGLNVISTPIKEMVMVESKYLTITESAVSLDSIDFHNGSAIEAGLNTWKARFEQVTSIVGDFL